MGLGIGYTLKLKKAGDAGAFLQVAIDQAKARGWKVRRRTKDSLAAAFSPHPKSEDLTLDFSSGPAIDAYLKTSFAPETVHVAIVEFFDALKPQCQSLTLDDETGYAEHRDLKKLAAAFGSMDQALNTVKHGEFPPSMIQSFQVFDNGTMAPIDPATGEARMSELQTVEGKLIGDGKKPTRRQQR